MVQSKRDIIKFEADQPIQLTLETDPATAKSYKRDSQWGTKVSFGIFCNDNRIFFASEALWGKLNGRYTKGDSLVITLVDGKTWSVSPSGEKQTSDIGQYMDHASILAEIQLIKADIEELKRLIHDKENQDTIGF